MNRQIRKSPVRLIDDAGQQVGIVPVTQALENAKERELDLVEVAPQADPPVVKIMDWGKAKFERDKRAREARRNTHVVEVKEVKFRPNIDDHDFERKVRRARRFLKKGNKVKVTVFFRYRQLRRPDLGQELLDTVAEKTAEVGHVDNRSDLEGRRMTMVLAPQAAH
ncbi:MAG TPA: translation initiation factor IF-3 [Thermoanaerobaculia bacterium]|nr:translation initiation factor IF-3 [Thermoanaerobaculia bacterium]